MAGEQTPGGVDEQTVQELLTVLSDDSRPSPLHLAASIALTQVLVNTY